MNTAIDKLKGMGFSTVSLDFYDKIDIWKSWYKGNVAKFHRYTVRNGKGTVRCQRYSVGMGKKVAEDWANLLLNEKVHITLEGEKEQQFVDDVFLKNNFEVKANELQEMAFALGTASFVMRVIGDDGTGENAAGIAIDYVTADHIFPITWQNGIITECAFDSVYTVAGQKYLYLQLHRVNEGGTYDIENHLYSFTNDMVGEEVSLASVRGFERIPAVVHTGNKQRQFVIDRPNIANNVDFNIPMGISIFANAIDQLKGVDIAYDSYVNEFVLGKKRIMVKPSATDFLDGEPVFNADDLTFYVLPEDIDNNGAIITPIDMALRTQEHSTGIQDQLNILSSKCGFGEAHYKFDNGSIATATQVISENSTMFRTIKKHEIILESALIELCRIILRLGNMAMNAGLNEDVEISVDFDDSIIEDKQTDFARDMQMLSAGVLNDWEFRMRWMNEDEATAKAALPKMEDMASEGQQEVE